MADSIKFTEEEQEQILTLRREVGEILTRLGQLEIEKKKRMTELETFENQLLERHGELAEKEQELFSSLNEKYGDGSYDPDTGIFTPQTEDSTEESE